MKVASSTVLLVTILVCLFPLCTRAQQAASRNFVTNPSLEDQLDDKGWPIGWGGFYPMPAGSYKFSVTDVGRTGKQAALIEGDGTFGAMPANRVDLDRTKRYVARGWVKIEGEKDATADVKLHYYAAGGRYIGQTRIGHVMPTTDKWQFVTVTDRAEKFPGAKKIGLAIAATGKVKAMYDDLELIAFNKNDLPKDFEEKFGITRSPQLALLGRRVGNWKTESVIKPCAWVPDGSKSTGVETIRWSLGGQFIEGRARNETRGVDSLFLMTFDRMSRKYRFWRFDSQGDFLKGDFAGTWDEATQTFKFESQEGDGVRVKVWIKLDGDDLATWGGTWTDKDGKVLLDMTATMTRQKQ